MQRRQWTAEDLERLQKAAATLTDIEVWNVWVDSWPTPVIKCQVHHQTLLSALEVTGTKPEVRQRPDGHFEARAVFGNVEVFALFNAEQLPLLGYQVPEVKLVPLTAS